MRTNGTLKKRLTKKEKVFLASIKENGKTDSMYDLDVSPEDLEKMLLNNNFYTKYYGALGITEKQEKFIEIYIKKLGNVKQTCKAIYVGRTTFYTWLKKNANFESALKDAVEGMHDDVESILHEKVFVEKDTTCLIYYTKTKMKDRGYVETVVNHNTNEDITSAKLRKMSDEELDKIIEEG